MVHTKDPLREEDAVKVIRGNHCWRGCLGLSLPCLSLRGWLHISCAQQGRALYFKCPQRTGTTILQHSHIFHYQVAVQIYLYTISFHGQN